MIPPSHSPPRLEPHEAERIARERFGIEGSARPLPSERDQNFALHDTTGVRAVLKISQTGEDRALLECQNAAFERIARAQTADPDGTLAGFRFPHVLRTRDGASIDVVDGRDGHEHLVRLLEWVPGRPLAVARPHAAGLLRETGTLIGAVGTALQSWDAPAARRTLHWDLQHHRSVIDRHMDAVPDRERRALVRSFLPMLAASEAGFATLRRSVIHGDANDWNILVDGPPADDPAAPIRVRGLIDLGDIVESWTVGDLAIACAYLMLDKRDPLAAAAHVTAGYHAAFPLPEPEIAAVFPLICARLCTSVVLAAHQRGLRPENEYLSVSEEPAWTLLEQLAKVHVRFAHYVLRDVCGLAGCPTSERVVSWIVTNARTFEPVLGDVPDARAGTPLAERAPLVLDMSVSSTDFPDAAGPYDLERWSTAIGRVLRDAETHVAIGRYDEPRPWYLDEAFRIPTETAPEGRTVHIGIDLFAPPGTPLFAPLDATVHGFADNAADLDYGPTIVLAHETADGTPFWTLWGHLSADSLDGLVAGARIRAGERFARIGPATINGGWPPHVHIQLVIDPLDHVGTFPGIARPGQLGVWRSLSPDPGALAGLPAPADAAGRIAMVRGTAGDAEHSAAHLVGRRAEILSESLSIAYRKPLVIVRGWMQYLYDALGQTHLDAVNNVAHVGHAHPHVTAAIHRQSAVLNTNTRYLHRAILDYAERLAATLPDPLDVCFLVCSGSEANELALRLARAHTGRRDVIVLEGGYHGNTTSLVEISPYKFAGPGGEGRAGHVHIAPLPDPYRGRHRGPESGARYVDEVARRVAALSAEGRPPGAFIAEALPGCGGQIVPPPGFLKGAAHAVREAGGVFIADEVQTGLGRVGTAFWAFQTQDVVPDIVTIGKPIGNGHPLGAVVVRREIAESFANGMEYFNTFGGNPVSCAAGMAVLDVIEQEDLQHNAARVGARLLAGLQTLRQRHALIGDTRGSGLYIGVELVRDREARTPAGAHASYVANRMREHGILLSTDGPDHNVLKIKPPLVFTEADADRLVETLDRVLHEDAVRID